MKSELITGFTIFVFAILSGCNIQPDDSQMIILTGSSSLTATPIITNTTTLTPVPSPTPLPPYEATIHTEVEKAMATHEYYMFTEVPATLEARNAKCRDGFFMEQDVEVLRNSSDEWTLFTCSPVPKDKNHYWTPGSVDYGTRYTQLIKNDLSKTWIIPHSSFDYSIIDRPDAMMLPFEWTADGKFLYLYPAYYPAGSGYPISYFFYSHINDLYRINLETGEFRLYLKRDQFSDIAFSPDDRFLVYSEYKNSDVIHIKNLETNNDRQVELNENIVVAGRFVWNEESIKVVIFAGYGDDSNDDPSRDLSETSIFVLDVENMGVQKVLSKDPRIFEPSNCSDNIFWLDENTMCLYSLLNKPEYGRSIFSFNIQTGDIKYYRSW
jgi:hypothetical protein